MKSIDSKTKADALILLAISTIATLICIIVLSQLIPNTTVKERGQVKTKDDPIPKLEQVAKLRERKIDPIPPEKAQQKWPEICCPTTRTPNGEQLCAQELFCL